MNVLNLLLVRGFHHLTFTIENWILSVPANYAHHTLSLFMRHYLAWSALMCIYCEPHQIQTMHNCFGMWFACFEYKSKQNTENAKIINGAHNAGHTILIPVLSNLISSMLGVWISKRLLTTQQWTHNISNKCSTTIDNSWAYMCK